MRTREEIESFLRHIDPNRYPELQSSTWDDIYDHGANMAPGGLYLATRMTRTTNWKKGDIVLDLACGNGYSSAFLVKHFGLTVVSVDWWVEAEILNDKFEKQGLRNDVCPLHLDITKELPFGENYFDAIFSMQALQYFGTAESFWPHLLQHLKPGGRCYLGNTCFNDESEIPDVFKTYEGWEREYGRHHSPSWWRSMFQKIENLNIVHCEEIDDGLVMWEDELLYNCKQNDWYQEFLEEQQGFIEQLEYSRKGHPYLTHFVAELEKAGRST